MDIQRPLFQSIACALAGVLFLNPIVATAAQVTLDASGGNTQLGQAANGVPVINIATPNANGLSHNKFSDFNVGQQGLILNNATGALQNTQLGGHIIGNANLGGRAAGIILNEVTGGSPSQLKGYTEVAGQSAHVVVANPYGVACDGCGFINTPKVTLSTGKPMVENGRLDRYDVDGGTIEIYGRGLNAANINHFELITRSTRLNAELHAQRLAVVAGRNEVDADSLQATAKRADGSPKPLLAIDSSALGGMYVGAIRLIGTEHGVGVRVATDMAASSADIDIDINGRITLKRTVAKGNIRLKGQDIVLADSVQAGGSATVVAADSLAVGKSLAAVKDLHIEAGLVDNRKAELVAGKSATIKAAVVDNRGGKVIGREALAVKGGTLDNREGGLGGKVVTTQLSGKLNNDKGLIEAGESLSIAAVGLSNTEGKVRSLGSAGKSELKVAGHLDNDRGLVEVGNQRAEVQAKRLTNSGIINASGDLSIKAVKVSNSGTIASGRVLSVESSNLANEGGLIFSAGDMRLSGDQLTNLKGDFYSGANLEITAQSLRNFSGTIESTGAIKIQALTLENARHTLDISTRKIAARLIYNGCYDCGGDKKNANFILEEIDRTEARNISARAALLAGGDMTLSGGAMENRHSLLAAGGNLRITAESFSNQGAQVGDIYTQRFLSSHRTRNIKRVHSDANAFNAQNWPAAGSNVLGQINQFMGAHIAKSHRLGEPVFTPKDDAAFDAVVQAGGKVQIDAKVIEQGVLRPGFDFVSGGDGVASRITINPQLRPDTSQQAIDPTTLPGFQLPEGTQGLFKISGNKQHPFLIETDPRFTALKQFLGSDYLLTRIGLTPDLIQRRLGDGFYEQRLVREALLARTGLRFIAGLNSDEAVFRHLMDNAIASKQALQLTPGVALSAEQVAALTHDIVWMQEQQIQGESVWVPVLYLAQVGNRLAPNGALIQGEELALISGSDLSNQGTLRATQSLQVTANQIDNSGLLEAGERLTLLARESIRNTRGGIISGEDIVATAVTGDLLNQRSITTHQTTRDRNDFTDPAARIEAGQRLALTAGRDLHNNGSHLQAGSDAQLKAGRDLLIVSSQTLDSQQQQTRKSRWSQSQTTQLGSEVQVGGDLAVTAGRDVAIVASQIEAQQGLALLAGRDITIASAANESHSAFQSKRRRGSDDQITQQSSLVQAGAQLSIQAGQDLKIIASQIKGAEDISLVATRDLALLAARNEQASSFFKKSQGSFGRSKREQRERYDSHVVGSLVEAGRHLSINTSKAADGSLSVDSGRNITLVGSQLQAKGDLTLGTRGDIAILSASEEHRSYAKKSQSGAFGLSKSAKSELNTRLTQVGSELQAGNDLILAAGNDISLQASSLSAGRDAELRAGLVNKDADINLLSATAKAYSRTEQQKKKLGLSASDNFLSIASTHTSGREAQSSQQVGSLIQARRDVSVQTARDIHLVGSAISAGRNAELAAGRDVKVLAARDEHSEREWSKRKQVGLGFSGDDNGVSVFVGGERNQARDSQQRQTAGASQIRAAKDLGIHAGRDIQQVGSDLHADHDIELKAGRHIRIDTAAELQVTMQERQHQRLGIGVSANHNFGKTKDAVSGAGKGDDSVSQGSSMLKAVDAVNQFMGGIQVDAKIGATRQSSRQSQIEQGHRLSTLDAGNDLKLQAGETVVVRGSQLNAGRDIQVKGRDLLFDAAQGETRWESRQRQSWVGVHGGTSGGFKAGIGGSFGLAREDQRQGKATASQLQAGRDIDLQASHDLTLIGTRARAVRDIELKAGNDLTIGSAQTQHHHESARKSGGGEVGLTAGSEGIGVYVSVNLGKGQLEREGTRQQEAYIFAGDRLRFTSGRDTAVAGAIVRGDEVIGRVGRDFKVSSVADTGKVKGKEFDLSATVTIGPGSGLSGSIGAGRTTGKTDWIEEQTRITAKNRLDIQTGRHTQIDGALIASDSGDLKLDTQTLGFRDIAGKDQEKGFYLNLGGTFTHSGTTQDSSQVDKGQEGESGWSVNGWKHEKDRQQIVRATLGQGDINVRQDAKTGNDSTAGLNRDLDKAYEITRDRDDRTELYITGSSVDALSKPDETLERWTGDLLSYDQKTQDNFEKASHGLNAVTNRVERVLGREMDAGAIAVGSKALAEETLEALILSGMNRRAAMELMADKSFQDSIIAQLHAINSVTDAQIKEAEQVLQGLGSGPGKVQLDDTEVSISLDELQFGLRAVSNMKEYLDDNPGKTAAVGAVLTMVQAPKAMLRTLVDLALAGTTLGEALSEKLGEMQTLLGKAIAQQIEGEQLDPNEDGDQFLIGGGELLVGILSGSVVGGKKGKESDRGRVKDDGQGAKDVPSIAESGASSAANAARLKMQLVAEQAAGARAPTQITSYSDHALAQFSGRDGGIGVSQSALSGAWASPLKIEYVPSKYGPTFRYTGTDAVIVVNAEGKVVTGWGKSALGTDK